MLLALQFFSINDIFLVPLCIIIMYAIVRGRANACTDITIRKYYYQAFYFKMFCVFAYTLVTEFYFGGGDTNLYYQVIKDLRAALADDFDNFSVIVTTTKLTENNPLAPYLLYDNYTNIITYGYMVAANNFFMPRLGLIPSLLFFNSYICICICFSMFALGGAIRLFKMFYYYYPSARKELALAVFFLPGVGFWSAGLLKDTICFGAVGFIVYGVFTIFIRKRKIGASLFWIFVGSYLLYMIKIYIFLVLILALVIWIFAETNRLVKDKTLRQIFALMTFAIAGGAGFFLLQYFTSSETLQQYQLDNLITSAEKQRYNYSVINQYAPQEQGSYYTINASNPVLLVVNSIAATFFRPLPWEVRSGAAILSAAEALAFIFLTLGIFFKKGLILPFKLIFKDPRVLFCFVFAIVFAVGVGASTANFGTLSRYKIPCMPFYLIMLLMLYRNSQLPYPKWLKKILGYIK